MKHPFKQAAVIINTLNADGHDAFFVGGSVRDHLMDRPVGDIDIATSAKPEQVQKVFDKVIPVGIEHGTVIVRLHGESYEVTTFRVDGSYTDQRHPDFVAFVNSIEADLQRRDFTINALAMDQQGNVIDPFAGRQDIAQHLIRTVGDGQKRFAEDALRILRGIRFTAQLGFSIEKETLTHMILMQADIRHLAVERIRTEMEKLITGQFIQNGLSHLAETGVYRHLPVIKEDPTVFDSFAGLKAPLNSFAELLAYNHYKRPDISLTVWIREWKASNQVKQTATTLIRALMHFDRHEDYRWLVYGLGDDLLLSFAKLSDLLLELAISETQLKMIKQNLQITSRQDMAIDGYDLLNLFPGVSPGSWLSSMLFDLEKQVVVDQLKNDKSILKEWARCHPPEHS